MTTPVVTAIAVYEAGKKAYQAYQRPTIPYLRYSGQRDQALVRAREAVDIFTALNATDPAAYGPKLEAAKKLLADLQP
ncbi:hypothetical protein [Streptomyces sp. NPDC097640]|uniref:hypothetical protein n=1 Tax=Streptomyces sp. NPDC097640 TaxID=3157229 RepID=UPI00331674CC